MKYISELYSEIQVGYMEYSIGRVDDTPLVAVVADTESSVLHRAKLHKGLEQEWLGYGFSFDGRTVRLVCHTKKTASFHKYIQSFETHFGTIEVTESDRCILDNGTSFYREVKDRFDSFVLSTPVDIIEIGGTLGSVVMWQQNLQRKRVIGTLYNAIGAMCQQCNVNLLRYKTLYIHSPIKNMWCKIVLRHDAEAESFFSKMTVDVL